MLGLLGWMGTAAALEARAAGPTLAVRSLAAGVELSWPLADGTYALETTLALGPTAAWTEVTTPGTVADGRRVVIVSAADQARYFRLRATVLAPVTVAWTSPAAGEAGVSVKRETTFRLSAPLAARPRWTATGSSPPPPAGGSWPAPNWAVTAKP